MLDMSRDGSIIGDTCGSRNSSKQKACLYIRRTAIAMSACFFFTFFFFEGQLMLCRLWFDMGVDL